FGALGPSDRVSIATTSGQFSQDFTNDKEILHRALLNIIPRNLGAPNSRNCPDIPYYMADLIENKSDTQALAVATEDALQCAFNGDPQYTNAAHMLAQSTALTFSRRVTPRRSMPTGILRTFFANSLPCPASAPSSSFLPVSSSPPFLPKPRTSLTAPPGRISSLTRSPPAASTRRTSRAISPTLLGTPFGRPESSSTTALPRRAPRKTSCATSHTARAALFITTATTWTLRFAKLSPLPRFPICSVFRLRI